MPQTTELNLFKAAYPILAPAQKPGGVTISTTLWAHAVPNKPQWTGTQMAVQEEQPAPQEEQVEEEPVEEEQTEEEPTEEEPHPTHGRKPSRRRR